MEIRFTGIGTLDNHGWLVIEEGKNRCTYRLSPEEAEALANQLVFELKKYARAKREIYGLIGKQLSEATDQTTEEE